MQKRSANNNALSWAMWRRKVDAEYFLDSVYLRKLKIWKTIFFNVCRYFWLFFPVGRVRPARLSS